MLNKMINKVASLLQRKPDVFLPFTELVFEPTGEFISVQKATMHHIRKAKEVTEDDLLMMSLVIAKCIRVNDTEATLEDVLNFDIALYHQLSALVFSGRANGG